MARAAARAERANQRARNMQEREHRQAAKAADRQAKADYLQGRIEEAAYLSEEVRSVLQAVSTILARALDEPRAISAEDLYISELDGQAVPPQPEETLPPPPGLFARLLQGGTKKHHAAIAQCRAKYEAEFAEYSLRKSDYEASIKDLLEKINIGDHDTIVVWLKAIIERTLIEDIDAISADVGYSADSRHVVVDLEMPDIGVIPEQIAYKYVKTADRIDAVLLTDTKRGAAYSSLICQLALKCVDTVFRGSSSCSHIDNLTLNGMIETIDPTTGREVRVCLLSVRIDRDTFATLNLSRVHPEQCLRSLKASVSRAPSELVPVKPIIELDMVDPRFIDTMDVASRLDSRTNLMDLTPSEFEGLITNLFSAMGLETRQTQASRDGGVDCVAFRTDPIFGGKVVIQAKRYKHTVGVSAVRDLFGTMQNEGAMKGILVTTSGYGKASFEFARGKPIELLDGGNLLHLLAEHLSLEAKILMPDDWAGL